MTDNVIINKCASIERCLKRIREEYADAKENLVTNFTKQDAIILNVQRACEQSIDLAAYLIRKKNLGIPQSSRDEFNLLEQARIIPPALSHNLQKMVGFRNIVVHEYQSINLEILHAIVQHHLVDFEQWVKIALGN